MFEKLIQATISSLGYLENNTYFPEPDCLVGIHDLIRFLHKDKDTLDARRICLVNNIVRNDLVPLLLAKNTDKDVFDSALRLTVNLCQPIIVAFGGKMPESEDIIQVYHDAESNLVSTLAAFTKIQLFEKFADILESFFAKEWADRNESDKTNVDRIIMLIRYIFAIGMECPMTVERPKIDSLVKERMIRAFLRSKMPSVLMKVGADRMERELSVHIMGTFSLMLRSIDCESVAAFKVAKTLDGKEQEEEELRAILDRDRTFLKARRSQLSTNRNHLCANYILKNAALNPENDLLVQKSNISSSLDNLRSRKRNYRTTKRSRVRDVMESAFKPNKSAPADLCQLLHEFCTEFITNAFDKVMKATREVAFMSHKAGGVLAYSDVNYFFLAEYVLQFIRIAKMPIEKASSIFSREFFHHIISQCETYFELMKTDKYRITSFAVRAQHAISAYKEMMLLLNSLAKSERFMDKEMFSYMTQTIYYNEEYREFPYLILNRLQPQGMTRTLLNDLVIASHYYIATMDHIIKTGELQIVAKRKRIAKQRKKKGQAVD
ncbi:TIMELESS domain-containing protein [Aphelenchoides bicaudatus]|nr:TIMELESS domain-containing protein [Aphelenchoides bicaudatus]